MSSQASTENKKQFSEKELIEGGNFLIRSICIILVIVWTNVWWYRSLLSLAPCYAIRARETVATKDQKTLDRIKNRKNHKIRLLSSSVWWLIAVMLVIGALIEQANPTPAPQSVIEKQTTPEEQAKIDADKKAEEERIAEEKKKQEEYEKSPEYQAKIQKEKIEKVIKQRKSEMYIYCQKSIKQLLAFPETADFSYMDRNARAFGEWIVIKSYVEYKNAYNIPLKSNFRCEYKEVEGTWTLIDAKLE